MFNHRVDTFIFGAYPRVMTILLTKEQEALLEKAIEQGIFDNPEDFIDQSLTAALSEQEGFALHLRTLLEESKDDIANGRVVEIPRGQLLNAIRERRKKASGQ